MPRGIVTLRINERLKEKEWGPDGDGEHSRGHLKKVKSYTHFTDGSILWNLRMARVPLVTVPWIPPHGQAFNGHMFHIDNILPVNAYVFFVSRNNWGISVGLSHIKTASVPGGQHAAYKVAACLNPSGM